MRRRVSLAFSQKRRDDQSSAATAVCRECRKRFLLSRRSNQHRRAGGAPHNGSRFCTPGCKQAAYRKRSAGRFKTAQGANTHATVTRRLQGIENVGEIGTKKTLLDRIVSDKRYPNMYRLKLADGSFSDMISLTACEGRTRCARRAGAAVSREPESPLAYVYDKQRCPGHLLQRGKLGYEAFAADDKSAGIFANPKEAAKALLGGES